MMYMVYYCVRMPWYELIWYLYITYNYITLTPTIFAVKESPSCITQEGIHYTDNTDYGSSNHRYPKIIQESYVLPIGVSHQLQRLNEILRHVQDMGCPRSDCLHLQKILAGNSRIQITRSSHVAIGNPLEMEIFNGKIIYKNGGFWWIMVDVLLPRLITRRWSIDQTWKNRSTLLSLSLRTQKLDHTVNCGYTAYACLCPKFATAAHILIQVTYHYTHVTWCYVDVTCMSQTFWISHWMMY